MGTGRDFLLITVDKSHIITIGERLITQEISLIKTPEYPREAFNRQSKPLKDAFMDDEASKPKKQKKR